MTILRLAVVLLIAVFSLAMTTHAGRADVLAQAKCDEKVGTFTLAPYYLTNDGGVMGREGFTIYQKMDRQTLRCRFGQHGLTVAITLYPPRSDGICGAAGSVVIDSVAFGNVEMLANYSALYRRCTADSDDVTELSVHVTGGEAQLTDCRADRQDSDGKPEVCTTKVFDIDKLSAEYARIDNNLADPATQAAQSATRLPPENDLAIVFKAFEGQDGLPDCAHWFVTSPTDNDRYGRIAGKAGDRIYMRQGYPALCQRDDDACHTASYLIPGDRVIVNGICGAWTCIAYVPRLQSKPVSRGWVRTSQLYAVEPVKYDVPYQVKIGNRVFIAIINQDVAALQTLLHTGDEKARASTAARALGYASARGDLKMVDALLVAGVSPDAVDLNDGMGLTPLMAAAAGSADGAYVQTPDAIHHAIGDTTAVINRLTTAGADVNATGDHGWSALKGALEFDQFRAESALLAAGADANTLYGDAASRDETTMLNYAITQYTATYDPSFVRLLLEHGADPNRLLGDYLDWSEGDGPYASCFDRGSVNAGCTALMAAAEQGSMTLVRLLLKHGADPTITRTDGVSATDLAEDAKLPKIATLIQQAADQWKAKHPQP